MHKSSLLYTLLQYIYHQRITCITAMESFLLSGCFNLYIICVSTIADQPSSKGQVNSRCRKPVRELQMKEHLSAQNIYWKCIYLLKMYTVGEMHYYDKMLRSQISKYDKNYGRRTTGRETQGRSRLQRTDRCRDTRRE